jgi:hypothetical protein
VHTLFETGLSHTEVAYRTSVPRPTFCSWRRALLDLAVNTDAQNDHALWINMMFVVSSPCSAKTGKDGIFHGVASSRNLQPSVRSVPTSPTSPKSQTAPLALERGSYPRFAFQRSWRRVCHSNAAISNTATPLTRSGLSNVATPFKRSHISATQPCCQRRTFRYAVFQRFRRGESHS